MGTIALRTLFLPSGSGCVVGQSDDASGWRFCLLHNKGYASIMTHKNSSIALRFRSVRSLLLLAGILALILLIVPLVAQSQQRTAAAPTAKPGFPILLPGAQVRMAPIALGDLNGDGVDDMVVGASDGIVHAYTGSGQHLWSFDTGDMGIEGKAAIGDLDGDGSNEVVIGAGSPHDNNARRGGLYVFEHTGARRCSFTPADFTLDDIPEGIFSSPALVDLDQNDSGRLEIVFGGYDGYVHALHDDCTVYWQQFVRDTIWSSPAIADLDRDGSPEVVIGVDTHFEEGYGTEDGGRLHVYRADGQSELPGFPIQIDEVIWSSPALGDIDGDGDLEIVVGTGTCWSNPPCVPSGHELNPNAGRYMNAWHHTGQPVAGWPRPMSHNAFGSPALANLDADSLPEIIVNTDDGYVYAFNGDGSDVPGWPVLPYTPADTNGNTVSFPTMASPIATDLDGDGVPEIVLPSNWELVVWNVHGQQISRQGIPYQGDPWVLDTPYSLGSTASVGDIDGDGLNEIVTAGSTAYAAQGAIYGWDLTSPTNPETMPWPAFRRSANNHARLQSSALSTIVGAITDGNGTPVAGVTIRDNIGNTVTTGSDGNYQFSSVAAGTYTLSAVKTDCIFTPASRVVSVPPAATSQNFTATCTEPPSTISGRVSDGSGNGIGDVTIVTENETTTTTSDGTYTLSGLAAGTYTLNASKTNCTFLPNSRSVNVPPDATGQDFTATCEAQLHYAPDKLVVLRTFDSIASDVRQVMFSTEPSLPASWEVIDISDPHGIVMLNALRGTTDEPLQVIFDPEQITTHSTQTLGTSRYVARLTVQVTTTTASLPQTFEPIDIFIDLLMLEEVERSYLPYMNT
jgi:hypothetical protein